MRERLTAVGDDYRTKYGKPEGQRGSGPLVALLDRALGKLSESDRAEFVKGFEEIRVKLSCGW